MKQVWRNFDDFVGMAGVEVPAEHPQLTAELQMFNVAGECTLPNTDESPSGST
jgi:hypothetical protein